MLVDKTKLSYRLLRRLLLLIVATVLLATGLMIRHNWMVEHEVLHLHASNWARELRFDLNNAVMSEAHGFQRTLQVMVSQPAMRQMLAQENSSRLQADWTKLFDKLRAEHNVTHFYFISPNRTCLLRLHLPEMRGDKIDRHTLLEAERTGKGAWGLETGLTGVLTLRVIQPVFEGKRLVGYVEIGKEIEGLLSKLRPSAESSYQYAVLLHKEHVDRTNWETGMQMLGRQAKWEDLPRHVIEFLDPKLSLVSLQSILAQPDSLHSHIDGRTWHMQFEPLHVASGKEIGTLVALNDITDLENAIVHRASMMALVTLILAGVVLVFFIWLTKRFTLQLSDQEVQLHDSERRFRVLFDSSPDPVWIIDGHHFADCNQAAVDILGYPDKAALQRMHPSALSPEYQPDGESSFAKAERMMNLAQEKGLHRFEWVHRRLDGSNFFAEVTLSTILLQGHQVIHCLWRDISEEKEKDAELAQYRDHLKQLVAERTAQLGEARSKYQQLLDDMGDEFLAFSYTPNSIVSYVSAGISAIFGLRKEDVVGQSWSRSIQWLPEDRGMVSQAIQELLSGKIDAFRSEMRFVHPDGQVRTVYQTCHAVKDANGEAVSVDGVLTDITQRKQIEAELREAKRVAEFASQSKSAFLANMSHEIRTPMNGVLGMLEILAHGSLSSDERKMVDTIRRSARSLLDLLDDILDLSKIEAGKLSLVPEEISLETELDVLISLLDSIALDKQVYFSTFFDPALPQHVMGDGLRVRQILINLAGNAVKFSAGLECIGRVHLRAELERCENDHAWVTFTISDNGIGMDEETIARLFQPFEQADKSTTRKYGGTGLGLSISLNLTAMMGGKISVQSVPGQGTTFLARLPFPLVSECPNSLSPYDLNGLECIIVATEDRYVDDYKRYLSHAGAQTHAFADLASAWIFVRGLAPEIAVCMIVMDDPATYSTQEIVDRMLVGQPGDKVHLVNVAYMSVERGRRRRVRRLAERIVQIDREALTRKRFLEAVAAATGRAAIPHEIDGNELISVKPEQGLRILVAEDNEINRDVIRRQLGLLGHHADLAEDGQRAFWKWERGSYDLLLTDLHMPNEDGYELTTQIREAERQRNLRHMPIIALTANAMKGEEERCLKQGMDAYLSKPIELIRLKAVLDQWAQSIESSVPHKEGEVSVPVQLDEKPALPVFDPNVLNQMVGSDPAIHRRVLQKFLDSAQDAIDQLLQASIARDLTVAGDVAHGLKSAARSVGAMRFGELCEQMEHAGKSGDGERCLALGDRLREAFSEAVKCIKRRLEGQ